MPTPSPPPDPASTPTQPAPIAPPLNSASDPALLLALSASVTSASSDSSASPAQSPDSDRLARLALNHAVEPADPLIGRVLARHSPEEVLAAIHSDELADLEPDPKRRERLVDRCAGLRLRLEPGRVEAGTAAAEAIGARFLVPTDEDWPDQLDDLGEQRPIGIWAIGRWPPTPTPAASGIASSTNPTVDVLMASTSMAGPSVGDASADDPAMASVATAHAHPASPAITFTGESAAPDMIAVVGARACTGYGSYIAGAIGADLASAGFPVVSGAALGIDAAAHRGAIAVGGPTIAVLACGIDRVYPRVHEALLRTIAERGAVLSELPPGASPTRFRFLHRNRIIAALSVGTVVVEAARRSGSLVTARLTAELGRVVMAVPGPVTSDQSAGAHELIRDGATLVTDAAQVREACSNLIAASLITREATRPDTRLGRRRTLPEPTESIDLPELTDPIEQLVAEALPSARAPSGADVLTLARTAGLAPDAVFAALGRLAASGRAVRSGGGWMLATRE